MRTVHGRDDPSHSVSRHAAAALLGLAASFLFIVYETTMPFSFQFTRAQLAHALARAALIPFSASYETTGGPSDVLGNVVLFVPLGFFLALSPLLATRGRAARGWLLVLFGGLLSALIETVQLLIPSRFTQSSDIIMNTLGTAAGLWLAARGRRRFDQALESLVRHVREEPMALLAIALAGAILLGSLLPLDVSISRAFLLRHLREIDLHVLTSGGPAGARLEAATGLIKRAWLFLFWGAAMGRWLIRERRPGRAFGTSLAAGSALAVLAEGGQIFIVSRTLDPFAPLAGIIGAATGAAAAVWGGRIGLSGRRLLRLSLALYGCYLALDLISPLDPAIVTALLHGRTPPTLPLRFDFVPFREPDDATRMMVLGYWTARGVRFAPLGGLLVLWVRRRGRRWLVALAVVVAVFGCELARGRFGRDGGELTDVLMSLAGALLGALIASRLRRQLSALAAVPPAAGSLSEPVVCGVTPAAGSRKPGGGHE